MKSIKEWIPSIPFLLCSVGIALLVVQTPALATPVYVDASVAVPGDGSSWSSAYASLRQAVDASGIGAELWIAAGRYLPDDVGNRTGVLSLKQNMALLGGFTNGMESVGDRNPSAHPTILCGDVQNDGDASDNAEQIVRFNAAGCMLDGLVFRNGQSIDATNSVLGFRSSGVSYTTTRIANCVFSNNTGRVASLYGSPTFSNVVFTANSGGNGGVIRIDGANVTPKFLDCTFSHNTAQNGGAIYYDSSANPCRPVFERCVFADNTASSSGGAVYYQTTSPSFAACVFTNNSATAGGALYTPNSENWWEGAGLIAVDCEFIDNHASAGHGGVLVNGFALTSASGGKATFNNCLFSANTARDDGGVLRSAWGTATIRFDHCRFIANRARSGGVALINEGGGATLTFNTCDFIGNSSTSQAGGVVRANWVKAINFGGCRFVGNASKLLSGGVLYADANQWGNIDLTVTDSLFAGNVAQSSGGALFGTASGSKWIRSAVDRSLFIGNRAVTGSGGAFSVQQGTNRLSSCTFAWNQAGANGGLGTTLSGPLSLTNCIAWGNTAAARGDLFSFSGTVVPHLTLAYSSTDLPCDTIVAASDSFIGAHDNTTAAAYQFNDVGGNRVGDPQFAPIVSGSLAGIGAFDLRTGKTELSVSAPSLVPNAFADTALAIESTNVYWIVSNTESSITVMGDPSSLSPTADFAVLSPRLSSRTGRWTGAGWVADAAHSSCIDAGPEAWDVGAEPKPNGGRINMGFDAGNAFASQSALSSTIVVIR